MEELIVESNTLEMESNAYLYLKKDLVYDAVALTHHGVKESIIFISGTKIAS